MKLLPGLCVFLFGMAPIVAADFYVSPTGSDSASGDKAQPWKTIQKAASNLSPGDTAHVLAGTYHEKVAVTSQGKEGSPVTLRAEGKVIISGKGVDGDNILHLKDISHVRISGFEIRDLIKANDGSGIRVEGACTHIELRDNIIHELRGKDAMGITIYGTNATQPISHISIVGNEIYDCDAAQSEALTLNGNVTDFKIIGNVVHDVNNIGICMIGGEDWINKDRTKVTRNGVCERNKVMRARSSYGEGYAAGIYVDGGANIIVQDNEVTGCNLGIEVGAENKGTVARGVVVKNNIIWHNEKAGLVFGGYEKAVGRVTECSFLNNICYQNDRHADKNGELWIQWATGNMVKGNIFWAGGEAMLVQTAAGADANTLDGNTYYTDAGPDEATFVWKGEDLAGLRIYQKITRQDGTSEFKKPAFSAPEKGDFRSLPR